MPAGHAGLDEDLAQHQGGHRRGARRLEHDRVAGGHRGRDLVGDEVEGEVEGSDPEDRPEREPAREAQAALGLGVQVERHHLAADALGLLARDVKVATARSTSPRESLIVLAFSSVMARAISSLRRVSPAAVRWRISLRLIEESLRSPRSRGRRPGRRAPSVGARFGDFGDDLSPMGAADGDGSGVDRPELPVLSVPAG
jgi:hypothetical protein